MTKPNAEHSKDRRIAELETESASLCKRRAELEEQERKLLATLAALNKMSRERPFYGYSQLVGRHRQQP